MAGILAMITISHSFHVACRCSGVFSRENGLSLRKNSTTTAKIDPNWISTLNRSKNSCEKENGKN